MKLFISPNYVGKDKGDGGIRRVVEAQRKYLPSYGIEIVDNPEDADVVSVHAGIWVKTDKPVVSHCHGLYWAEYEWPDWAHSVNRDVVQSLRKADIVTAPSEWVADSLRRGMWLKPFVLGHGLDVEEWSPGRNQGYVLWNKTRVDAVCDPEPLNVLAKMASDIKFISTFGDYQPNVTITGLKTYAECKRYIRNAGVYLATSRETYGIGTLEAMACEVPILGWRWGGQAEFVQHKVSGYLARPGDYDDLLVGLRWCFANRKEAGKSARLSVPHWQDVMANYAMLYKLANIKQLGPKVSVIITCYNLAQYLEDAVKSVLNSQPKFKDFEIIVVDDASPDSTPEVVNKLTELAPDKIRYIRNDTNLYLAGSLNVGIEAARGKYIVPLDADNMVGENALKILSDALDKDRDIDIVYGAMEVIEPSGKKFVSGWPGEFEFNFQMMQRNQCPSTSMYRKRVWEQSGGYRRRYKTAEDADFWTRAVSLGFKPKRVTDAVTLIYRDRPDSMSHTNKQTDWTSWFPWSRNQSITPFGVIPEPSKKLRVPTFEPPFVSVIIPVGPDHTEIVIDAVDSVVAQTFERWECIVINDSGKKIKWLPPFVKVIDVPDAPKGPSVARNLGIKASRAETFIPLDADDYLQPTALDTMYSVYKNNGGYVYCDWIVHETREIKTTPEYKCEDFLRLLPHAVTALYPVKAWREVGGFDEQMEAWEDWDFALSLASYGYCGTRVPEALFSYRVRAGQRREMHYANRDKYKEIILNKWKDYIVGGKQLMGCRGCGGSRANVPSSYNVNKVSSPVTANVDGMVLLEYTKTAAGTISYRGPATGTLYRFSNDSDHRIRYVFKADAEALLQRQEFKLFVPQDPKPELVVA